MIKLNRREFIILIFCAALLLVFAARQWIVLPALENGGNMDNQIRANQMRLAKARGVLLLKDSVKQRYEKLVDVIGVAGSEAQEMSAVVYKVQAQAGQMNIHISNIQPQRAVTKERIVIFPVELEINGQWRDIVRFISALQAGPNNYFINSLALEKGVDPNNTLTGRMTLSGVKLARPAVKAAKN